MSPSHAQTLEDQVVENLKMMLTRYQRIDRLADDMLAKQRRGEGLENDMQTLQCEREAMQELEQQIRPINDSYRESNRHASEAVKLLSTQTTTLVQALIEKIAQLEASARQAYQRLVPEINQNLRGQQMKQAYGKSQV